MNISTQLTNPATKEIISIVQSGFIFKIRFYGSVIVNDHRVYRFEQAKSLCYKNSLWYTNDSSVTTDLQNVLGRCDFSFNKLHLKDGDRLIVYISASIPPDKDFEISTGLTTAVLWNYYVPHIKLIGTFSGGELQLKE